MSGLRGPLHSDLMGFAICPHFSQAASGCVCMISSTLEKSARACVLGANLRDLLGVTTGESLAKDWPTSLSILPDEVTTEVRHWRRTIAGVTPLPANFHRSPIGC